MVEPCLIRVAVLSLGKLRSPTEEELETGRRSGWLCLSAEDCGEVLAAFE